MDAQTIRSREKIYFSDLIAVQKGADTEAEKQERENC